jgi:putative nucleotidyltransferase with HDIG domain
VLVKGKALQVENKPVGCTTGELLTHDAFAPSPGQHNAFPQTGNALGNIGRDLIRMHGVSISVVGDKGEPRDYRFHKQVIHVGRDSSNDIVLQNPWVSGRHGRIAFERGRWWFTDLCTTNGTFVQRQQKLIPIDKGCRYSIDLHNADEVLLGKLNQPTVLRINLNCDCDPITAQSENIIQTDAPLLQAGFDFSDAGAVTRLTSGFDRLALLTLYELCSQISPYLDLDRLLEIFAENVLRLFRKASHIAAYLLDDGVGDFVPVISRAREGEAEHQPLSRAVRDRILERGQAIVFSSADGDFDLSESLHAACIKSVLCAPLWTGQRIIGLVQIDQRGRMLTGFDQRDLEVFAVFAHQAALGIENARLHAGLKITIEQSINGLVRALEAKDEYTSGHSETVANLCNIVAEHMQLPRQYIETLTRAATLHDIGKIGIPDRILKKKGTLGTAEHTLIRSHPESGARILEPFDFFAPLIPIIMHHHERWDGHGYPCAVAGEAIPLGARILAVADTYDALVSDRVYRPGVGVQAAVKELQRVSGSQLDPELVSIFIHTLKARGHSIKQPISRDVLPPDHLDAAN